MGNLTNFSDSTKFRYCYQSSNKGWIKALKNQDGTIA